MRDELSRPGLVSEVFTFVDATDLMTKSTLWKERDKAIKAKYDKLNNEVLPEVAHDKQARIGCKGNDNYWYGYKQHTRVDMQSGLINKVAITPANVTDAKGLRHVCPDQGAIYADKGYCTEPAQHTAKGKGCHLAAILKNNMLETIAIKIVGIHSSGPRMNGSSPSAFGCWSRRGVSVSTTQ